MKFILFISVSILLCGCYTERTAKGRFGKAVTAYPKIAAEYCGLTYPCKDSVKIGKDSIRVDTLWGEGEITIIRDTLRSKDTIWIKTVQQLPGTVIYKTVLRTDTIYQTDKAAFKVCDIERGQAIELLNKKTIEYDKWKAIAKKRFWIICGLGLLIGIGLFFKLRSFKLPIPKL